MIRVIANWSQIAPRRPASPASPGDRAYHFEGLDDLVWQSELRGMRVLLTVWGTPRWASRSGKPNAAPAPRALGSFCSALATRYSGHYRGQPFVGLYSVWNEPNLQQFLAPQFDVRGHDLSPRLYAGMARSCAGAIERASPRALVALGDTSPRGRDHPHAGAQASHSPGRFAQLVAPLLRGVRFDAWAHHPYAQGFTGSPTSSFRRPNVGIGDLARFELGLRRDFHRRLPIWITEFAYQTAPEHRGALSYARQAAYLTRSIEAAVAVPEVQMFVWYVFRDTRGARWQSGLIARSNVAKPSLAAFTRIAARLDVANPTLSIAPRPDPRVTLSLLDFEARQLPTDPPLGMTYRVFDPRGQLVAVAQPRAALGQTGRIVVQLDFTPQPRTTYTVTFDLNDIHGDTAVHHATLIVRSA